MCEYVGRGKTEPNSLMGWDNPEGHSSTWFLLLTNHLWKHKWPLMPCLRFHGIGRERGIEGRVSLLLQVRLQIFTGKPRDCAGEWEPKLDRDACFVLDLPESYWKRDQSSLHTRGKRTVPKQRVTKWMNTNQQVYQLGSPAGPQSATCQPSDLESELLWGFNETLHRPSAQWLVGRRPLIARSVALLREEWDNGRWNLGSTGVLIVFKDLSGVWFLSSNVSELGKRNSL